MAVADRPALVGVVMGSASDSEVMEGCIATLKELTIPYEVKVLSAHRTPDLTRDYAQSASERGVELLIAAAGWAAHLAGVLAAHTRLPVIGVPISASPVNGLDALLSMVQMPPGVPVATVAIGKAGARNAGLLAVQILAVSDTSLAEKLADYKKEMAAEVAKKEKKLNEMRS